MNILKVLGSTPAFEDESAERDGDSGATREFQISVDKSLMDHQGHVERQLYYWGYKRNTHSAAYTDLKKTVPMEGLSTIAVDAPEVPNRIVRKNIAEVNARKTLRQLWEERDPEPSK